MNPIKFPDATIIGKPKNWDDAKDGECVGLPAVIAVMPNGMKSFTSVWMPTEAERHAIAQGANVALTCFGAQVPVMLSAADIDGEIVRFQSDLPSDPD